MKQVVQHNLLCVRLVMLALLASTIASDTECLAPHGIPPVPKIAVSASALSPSSNGCQEASPGSFDVWNKGDAGSTLSYSITVDPADTSWLRVTPSYGTSMDTDDRIQHNITYVTTGLAVGTYATTILVSDSEASNNPQSIMVTLTVNSSPPPMITLSEAALSPSTTSGSDPPNQTFMVQNSGCGELNYSVSVAPATPGDPIPEWLTVSPPNGTGVHAVTYSTGGLPVGLHEARIVVADPDAANTPQIVPVTLRLNGLGNVRNMTTGVLTNSIMLPDESVPETLQEYFGNELYWDREDPQVLFRVIVSANDPTGVVISNLRCNDTIEITSASGQGTFLEPNQRTVVRGVIGLVATGAQLLVGCGEADDPACELIADVASWFDEVFGKPDDPEYVDASGLFLKSGKTCRQAGGILLCLPQAQTPLHSGDNAHQELWIPSRDLPRTDGTVPGTPVNVPAHVLGKGFFFVAGELDHNKRTLTMNGQVYILAWDYKFEDNKGTYQAFVLVTKGPDCNRLE